jgi:hypothetical protein
MAEIHDGLAGRGQILPGHFINPSASAHDYASAKQLGEMFGGVVVAASGDLGQFGNGAWFAGAQFPEHLPARAVAKRGDQPFYVGQGCYNGAFWCLNRRIHANQGNLERNRMQGGKFVL